MMPPLLTLYLAFARVSEPLWRLALHRRARRGREDPARMAEKFGRGMAPRPKGPVVWFHALSVGESLALLALLNRLAAARPDLWVLLTTSTRTSVEAWDRVGLPPRVIHQYAPVDAPGPMRRFLRHWKPAAAVFAEFDLWPVRMLETTGAGVPAILINSRLSAGRFEQRMRMARVYGWLLARFRRILLQDAASVPRFVALGAPADRVAVMGVLKAAAAPLPDAPAERAALAAAIGDRPLWFAAATERREEPQVIEAHRQASLRAPRLLLIIAPRHARDADGTEALARAAFAHVARRSRGEVIGPDTQVYIADTIGEMGLWYRLSPVSFVGHSLRVEGEPLSGKNPFEAAALGSVILYGPEVDMFSESYAALAAADAAILTEDAPALARAVLALQDPAARAPHLPGAARVMAEQQAPLEIALDAVLALLDGPAEGAAVDKYDQKP